MSTVSSSCMLFLFAPHSGRLRNTGSRNVFLLMRWSVGIVILFTQIMRQKRCLLLQTASLSGIWLSEKQTSSNEMFLSHTTPQDYSLRRFRTVLSSECVPWKWESAIHANIKLHLRLCHLTTDCWEKEGWPLPWMSPLIGCLVQSGHLRNNTPTHTTTTTTTD